MGKSKKEIGLVKDELGRKTMIEFVALRPKTYADAIDVDKDNEFKKSKGTKKWVIKEKIKFEEYKDYLLNAEAVLKSQQKFKSERHGLYIEEVHKIALRNNDDKRLQTFDKTTTYPYRTSAGKACKAELLSKVNIK